MNTSTFDDILKQQIVRCVETLSVKADEYATEDRLHNFKKAAVNQNITPIQACAGMMAKHTGSVYDMCASGKEYPIEMWEEKITDHINYLILLRALVHEDGHAEGVEKMTDKEFNRARRLSEEIDAINTKIETLSSFPSGSRVITPTYRNPGGEISLNDDDLQGLLEYLKQSAKQKQTELERILKN